MCKAAAEYIDDIPEPIGTLHIAIGGAPVARGVIRRIDLSDVHSAPDVVAVHHRGATFRARTTFRRPAPTSRYSRTTSIDFHSQPVFAVVATTRDAARRAALRGKIEVDAGNAECLGRAGQGVRRDACCRTTPSSTAMPPRRSPPRRFAARARFSIGGQEHFYLEGQVALAVPGEDGAVLVYSSTQHPSEVQHVVARVLACRIRSSPAACAAWAAASAARRRRRRNGR